MNIMKPLFVIIWLTNPTVFQAANKIKRIFYFSENILKIKLCKLVFAIKTVLQSSFISIQIDQASFICNRQHLSLQTIFFSILKNSIKIETFQKLNHVWLKSALHITVAIMQKLFDLWKEERVREKDNENYSNPTGLSNRLWIFSGTASTLIAT